MIRSAFLSAGTAASFLLFPFRVLRLNARTDLVLVLALIVIVVIGRARRSRRRGTGATPPILGFDPAAVFVLLVVVFGHVAQSLAEDRLFRRLSSGGRTQGGPRFQRRRWRHARGERDILRNDGRTSARGGRRRWNGGRNGTGAPGTPGILAPVPRRLGVSVGSIVAFGATGVISWTMIRLGRGGGRRRR